MTNDQMRYFVRTLALGLNLIARIYELRREREVVQEDEAAQERAVREKSQRDIEDNLDRETERTLEFARATLEDYGVIHRRYGRKPPDEIPPAIRQEWFTRN